MITVYDPAPLKKWRADAVVLPYDYLQKGIATRALELEPPVVTRRHGFVEQPFETGRPRLVEEEAVEDWAGVLHKGLDHRPMPPTLTTSSAERVRAAAFASLTPALPAQVTPDHHGRATL